MVNRGTRTRKAESEICRTCMSAVRHQEKRHRKLVPIFTTQLDYGAPVANIITDCTAVQIDENDGLPSGICNDCFETVKLLDAFAKTTRDSDAKLRKLCKTEPTGEEQSPSSIAIDAEAMEEDEKEQTELKTTTTTHYLEIKCEPFEETVDEIDEEAALQQDDDFEPENDSDTSWKESDEEKKRVVKRQKVGLKTVPKPRKMSGSPSLKKRRKVVQRRPIQKEEDMQLSEKEQELFTTIEVKPGSHVCCGCLLIFGSAEELETHRDITHIWKNESLRKPTSKLICEGCLRRFNADKSLNYHKERVRLLKVIWECNKCAIRFKVVGKRREHVRLHPADEPVALVARIRETTKQQFGWVCCAKNCQEAFTTENELLDHAKASHWAENQAADLQHDDKPEQCQVCFQRFADKQKVVRHQRRKYKFKNFQCALCGLKFTTSENLALHGANDHGHIAFKCEICQKSFSRKSTLAKHMEYMHIQQGKQHQCTVCGCTFRQKAGLLCHMAVHMEVPQFKCEVCSKMFRSKLRVRYHMRTHTGEKPYKCQYCDSAFANHTNHKRHEMTHTDDRPHKCSYCEKSFILKRTLRDHENTHTGAPKVVRNSIPIQQQTDDDVGQDSGNENSNQDVGSKPETVQ